MLALAVKIQKYNVSSVGSMISQIRRGSLIIVLKFLKMLFSNLERRKLIIKSEFNPRYKII